MNPNPKIILATPDILVIFEVQDTPLVEIIVTAQNNTIDITEINTVFPSNTFLPTRASRQLLHLALIRFFPTNPPIHASLFCKTRKMTHSRIQKLIVWQNGKFAI